MIDIFQGSGAPLSADGVAAALGKLQSEDAATSLWSLITVETRGFGYLLDKRPKILFERHVFRKRTGGAFDAQAPDLSNPTPGGYSGTGAGEYLRLKRAMLLDRDSALESASWGLGQIMGYNASSLGYEGAQDMIDAFRGGEDAQLDGCARFIVNSAALLEAFQVENWKRVAFFYNGKSYAKNAYDQKLATFKATYDEQGTPDVEVRAAQARLAYLGYLAGGIDGQMGPRHSGSDHRLPAVAKHSVSHLVAPGKTVAWMLGQQRLFKRLRAYDHEGHCKQQIVFDQPRVCEVCVSANGPGDRSDRLLA